MFCKGSRDIYQIKSQNSTFIIHTKEISNSFVKFYKHLYSFSCPEFKVTGRQFLDVVDFQNLMTLTEILEAINSFPNGKAAGPDGFSAEFIKLMLTQLLPC